MKAYVLVFWSIMLVFLSVSMVNAKCTASCPFVQPYYCTSGAKDAGPWVNGTTANFWCLSDSSGANDQGTGFIGNWWQQSGDIPFATMPVPGFSNAYAYGEYVYITLNSWAQDLLLIIIIGPV